MKIQLKRSSVLDGGVAKQPTAGQMEYGELAVNYNENDPAIFIKDSNNQIIRIAGAGYDYNDLENIPTIGDGTITISANGETVGTFTVNQEGDTEIELPDSGKLNPPSPSEPGGTNENGDLWIDSSACPPVLKIWSDCDGTGKWYVLAAAGPQPIAPQPGDGSNSTTPAVLGSGTEADPYILTAATVEYGETAESVETISLIGQTPANLVQWSDINSGSNGNRFAQPVGVIAADGTWSGKVYFADAPDSTSELTYEGLLKLGGLHYKWAVTMEEPANLTVGKGALSPTSGETGQTFTGSATVVNAENPVEVHVFSMDGVEVQRGASNSYVPTAEGNLTYHKEVTDDNNSSPVIGDESDPAVITQPPGPTATMSGLRFDNARNTQMLATLGNGNTKVWTFSCWVKNTHNGRIALFGVQDGGNYQWIGVPTDGTLWVFQSGTGSQFTGASIPKNVWTNVIVTREDTDYTAYVNGVAYTGSNPAAMDLIGANKIHGVGSLENGSNSETLDGYLSDCYFVDGKVAPPTTFGKYFPGDKWGPLDSAVVQNNLNNLQPADPEQPYDSRANTDQVWSSTASGTFYTNGKPNIYNGLVGNSPTSAYASYTQNTTTTVLNGVSIPATKLRLYVNNTSNATVTVNTNAASANFVDSWGWVEVTGWTSPITSIELTDTTDASISAVEINGRLLVDSGLWNNSQNWSDGVTNDYGTTTGPQGKQGPGRFGFDGDLTTEWLAKNNGTSVWTYTGADLTGPIRMYVRAYGNANNKYGDFKVNGVSQSPTQGTEHWHTVTGVTGALTEISIVRSDGSATGTQVFAVEVNGAILVDAGAQWNTSQRWSAGWSSVDWDDSVTKNGTKAFDGNYVDSSNSAAQPAGNQVATWTGSIPIPNGETVVMYYRNQAGGADEGSEITVNGIKVSNNTTPDASAVLTSSDITAAAGSEITEMTIDNKAVTNNGIGIAAIIVGGKVLVDAAFIWNSSQVWSESFTASNQPSGQSSSDAFNGSLANGAGPRLPKSGQNKPASLTGLSFTNATVKVYVFRENTGTIQMAVTAGDQTISNQTVGTSVTAFTLNNCTGTSIDFLFTEGGVANTSVYIAAIEIDGEILVDAGFGSNGFYLPFDPAQTGENWVSLLNTTNVSTINNNYPKYLFDGNSSTFFQGRVTGSGPVSINTTGLFPAENGPYVLSGWVNDRRGIAVNGNAATSAPSAEGPNVVTCPSVTEINSIDLYPEAGDGTIHHYGLFVNGKILVDHSSIGKDLSGNGNNFKDENFVLESYTTNIPAANWTSKVTGPSRSGFEPANAFNGSTASPQWAPGVGGTQVFTPNGATGLPFTKELAVYGYVDTGATEVFFVNGVDCTAKAVEGPAAGTIRKVVVSDVAGVTSPLLNITSVSKGSASNMSITAIEVDGAILVDNQDAIFRAAQDLVLDTPMKNYAVMDPTLNPGNIFCSNGNLNVGSNGGWWSATATQGASSGKIYYEYIMTSTSDKTASVGWRDQVDTSGNPPPGHVYLFNGKKGDKNGETPYGEAWTTNDVIGVAFDIDAGSLTFYKNGVSQGEAFTGLSSQIYYPEVQTYKTYGNINFGQQPWVYTPPVGYEGLYQTWTEYARTTLGYSLDRIAQLEQLRLLDAATIEDLRTKIAEALSRLASLESDEVNDDAVDNSLITLVGSLSTQITTFTDRIAAAEAAITDYEGRITTLES